VTLINTDGMAFIGPGSEWFWTAVSGLILAGTFIAIYRQLRIARNASAVGQVDLFYREWVSERYTRYTLEVFIALRDGTDRAKVPEGAAKALTNFWEKVATLTRGGHLDRKLLWNDLSAACELWWAVLAPFVRRWRTAEGDLRYWENFEWLAGLMAEMDRRAGVQNWGDTTIVNSLERLITGCLDFIRIEQSLRTVIVASPEAVTVAQPTVAAPPA